MQRSDLDAVTLEQAAAPGTTWVDSLQRCISDSDMVIEIIGDRRVDANIYFELGVASALDKPTLLFITPDYPHDRIPPSGIPYLRMICATKMPCCSASSRRCRYRRAIARSDFREASRRGGRNRDAAS